MKHFKKQLAPYSNNILNLSLIYSSKDQLFKVVATRILAEPIKANFCTLILHTTKVSTYSIIE